MSSSGAAGSSTGVTVQEYSVRVPKAINKQNRVMQFNSSLLVDFTKWTQVKMVREVPVKADQAADEPKFGAGSEFGKDMREEARRKKLGIVSKKKSADTFPWLMKVGGKTGKKYRGVRGGSVTENASYYVFTQAKDGAFEAYPVSEWYNFQPIQRYKALTAEEAEEQFNKRDKIMNYFSVMVKKRLKNDDEVEGEEEDKKDKKSATKKKKSGDFKLTDMDEWPDSSEEEADDEEGEAEDGDEKKKKKKQAAKAKQKKKKRKSDVKDEAFEESDDGDDEGREMDYISDSTDSEDGADTKPAAEEKGVDQEDALKRLLDSDAEVEESSEEEKKSDEEDEDKKKENEEGTTGEKKKKSKKKKKNKEEDVKEEGKSSDSEAVADSSDDEVIAEAKAKKANGASSTPAAGAGDGAAGKAEQAAASGDAAATGATPADKRSKHGTAGKRKVDDAIAAASKRVKLETSAPSPQLANDTGITEDAVRRYLTRKPMTTTELLQKFKSKKVGLSSDQLVPVIAQILKKINPNKQTIKSKMYLSIKK